MLGERISYCILRPLTHTRNMATEEEMNQRAHRADMATFEQAMTVLRRYISRFDGRFPLRADARYLDVGCGTGELTVALAQLGCGHVTGIDLVPRYIETCQAYARLVGVADRVDFVCADVTRWTPAERFDVVLSFASFEHIADPRLFLQKMRQLITPNGMAILAFAPLFHSPFGDHMGGFFRVQIPWRGVIFSEKAILRLRQECYRPTDRVERYQDIVGGLNLMRYSEFLSYVRDTGWQFDYLVLNPRLRKIPPLYALSNLVTRVPRIRDYFTAAVYCVLRRKE